MRIYDFFDTDETGTAEYDLQGEAYERLLQACFAHCASVAFLLRSPAVPDPVGNMSAALPVTDVISAHYRRYAPSPDQLRHYRLTPPVRSAIAQVTSTLFSWLDGQGFRNPEDPLFLRTDGSVFLSTVIHEGVCTLHAREEEDVSALLGAARWSPR